MKNNSLALTTVVVMLVNLVGPVLAPLPAAAAPSEVGALPSWFAPASAATSKPEAALPSWFSSDNRRPAAAVEHPASSALPAWFSPPNRPLLQSHHTIYPNDVTVSGPAEINNCDPVTFTIVATNDSVTTTNVIITSTMPTGFVPGQRIFDVGAVAPNQTITRTASFDAGCDAVSGQNAVMLTQGGGVDPIVVYTEFLVNPGAITLRKVPSVIPAAVGDVVTWTVIVENTGYGRVDNVIVTDTLGTGLDFVSGDLSASTASLAVGDFLTFTVSARVTECTGLDNDVAATWGCPDQTCQTHTAQASIDLQLNVPYLDYTLPNFDINYCEGSGTFTIPVVNSGAGTAHNVVLDTNMSPFSVTALSPGAVYTPGIGFSLPDVTGESDYDLVCELAAVSPCALSPSGGGFDFQLEFDDDCGNPYVLPVKQENWTLSGGVPSLSISKDMPGEIYLGEAVTPTITVEAANVGYSPVIVTDTLPPGWTVENPAAGNLFTDSGTTYITWTVSGDATTILTPVIRSPVVSDTSVCDYCATSVQNTVEVRATDCQTCEHTAQDTASTYIQCEDILNSHDKQVSPAAAETCTGFVYTSTYVFASSFNVTPTWGSMIFTDDLPYQNYLANSASIQLSNGSSCPAVFSETVSNGRLVITNISPTCPIALPGTTMIIAFQSTITAPGGCGDLTFYDWSRLNLGVTGNGICADDGILEEGVYVSADAPQMALGIDGIPANVEPCAEYTITLTLTRLGDAPAKDVALRFDTVDYAVVELLGFGGLTPYFTHTDALSYTWFYSDDFTTATTATVYLRVQRHCDAVAGAVATAWYEGNCEDDDEYFEECHVNAGANPPPLWPSLIVAKYPELYYADDDVVTWTLTLINSGPAVAHDIVLTDALGSGLRYYTSTITTTRGSVAGVVPEVTGGRWVTWTLADVPSGAQVTIKFVAEVVGCEDLTNEFSGWQSCLGRICEHKGPKTSYVLLPDTVLINTNNALSPLSNCFTRTITATVKNAGLMSVYSATVIESLPPGMFYETGSTRYVVGTGATPPPTGWVAGGEPAGAPLGPLVWSSDQITNLAHLYPNETVWIRFDVRADCNFEGGNITIQASYEDVCGDPQTSSASHFAMNADPPEVTASKVGRNVTTGSDWGGVTYAEPGDTVQWRITVNNDGGSDAPLTTITDTLPSNTSYVSADPAPTSQSGGVVVWDIGTLAATSSRVFTVTTTVNMGECSEADLTNVVTATWGCPSPVCRRIATTQARLRTRPLLYPSATTDLPPATLHQCGGVITATLYNAGLSAYDVTMTDTLPLGFVYSGTVGYSTAPSGTVDLGQTVVYTWAVLPTGSTYVAFEVVNDAAGGWCEAPSGSNVITVTYDDSGSCVDTGPYDAAHLLPVTMASPVLEVNKLPEQQIADVGDMATWTIVVSNTGTGVADNLTITDVVASNYDSDSITATIGSDGSPPIVVTSTNTITWTPDPILVGGVWTATVSAELVSAGVNRNVVTATTYCDTGCAAATGGDTAYVTLLEVFEKNPPIQTGTIGSLVVFGLAISLSDSDALYEGLTLTDTLPTGLGYVGSEITYIYDSTVGPVISATPTITPGWLDSGDVIWQLGDLSGTVQINGVITAVIQDDPAAYDGARLVNDLRMTYTDDTRPYIYTDTADVDVLEPLLHIGKSYVTPEGCGATLFQDNFNDGDASGWSGSSGWSVADGVYRTTNDYSVRYNGDTAWTDYSFSAMMRADDDNAGMGLRFRYQDYDNYYWFYWQSDRMRLARRADGTTSTVEDFGPSDGYEPGRWYHVEVRVEGRQIRIYVDGQLRIDYYDLAANAPANGSIGLYSGVGSGVRMFDDVLVTRLDRMACTVGAGDHVTYTIAISNQARLTGYDLVITDAIPSGTSLLAYTMESDDPASVVTAWPVPIPGATGDLVWRINQLAAASPFSPLHHTALTLTVVLAVSEGITANVALPNQALLVYGNWAGSSEPLGVDRDYSGGSHSTAIRSGSPDLNLTKSTAPSIADLGDSLTYTITVLNTGIVSATGVIITDVVPAYTSFVAATLPHTGPDSSGVITWPLGVLDIGESNTVTMVVQVSDTVPSGTIINNIAWVTCTEGISDTDTVTTPLYAALGDYVWEDMDADGVQNEGGTTGVAGVTVTLYTGAGAPLSTTTTNASGYYSFTRLIPGDYYVVFNPPPTYTITFRDQGGDDGLDSDADRTTGQTIVTTLESAERDWTWDAGLYIPASLGDYVWEDANLDGIQNDGPTGIEGVTVTLYTGAGVLTGTTTTDGSGYYSFTNLLPGDYYVLFTPTAGYTFTLQDQGGNDGLDSDADVATGQTIIITLDSGEEDWTWDAGLYRMDYGDAPDPTYPTTNGSDGARHVILPAGNPTLGSIVDAETDGQPNVNADGDDTLDGSDDEDGVTFDSPLVPGEVATITVSASADASGLLNGWLDFGGDGDWNETIDQIATDLTINAGTSVVITFTVPYTAHQGDTYSRFRFSTQSGLAPTGRASDGEVEDYLVNILELDYGDAPDSDYSTVYTSDGARHIILPSNNPTLGSIVDAETDGQPNVNADGDDIAGSDDEDGVSFDSDLVPGEIATITVSTAPGAGGILNGWIDFTRDYDWDDADEQVVTDLPIPAGAVVVITFTVPPFATQDSTYARFRFSTDSGLTSTGLASDGEIEDYIIGVHELDYGDAPDSDYSTVYTSDGARHVILPSNNPTLGSTVDDETDGAPSVGADGDDTAGIPDDEDGVLFGGDLTPGEVAVITVTAAPAATGVLNGWIDFGGDGDWSEAVDQIVANRTIPAGTSVAITFNVPVTARQGITTYARFRFSTQPDLTPTGLAPDGEVEDYAVRILRLDYGDAPEPTYPTYHASDGPRHIILDVDNPTLGATVDAETDGQPNGTATGDDVALTPDDEDGVRLDSPLIAGEVATLTITGTNVTGARLNAWIDFNGDGAYEQQIATDTTLNVGANVVTFTVPTVVLSDTLNGRFRYSTQTGLTPTGLASDGEIEDHQFGLTLLDLGDLPDVPYPTLLSSDGARHVILEAGNPTLGVTVDAELDGQPNVTADGDDNNGVPDDEDGVTFSGPLVPGEVVTITVSATADATGLLNAWIDFDGNGSLTDSGEQIALNVTINAGGSVQLLVPVPVTATQGITTYSRFRFSTQSGLAPTGRASDGEVEDYAVRILRLDYGDAPEPTYPTYHASDGPRHIILDADNPTLGTTVDAEEDGQPNGTATGDDVALMPDDEDGVRLDSPLIAGEVATLTITGTNVTGARLNAWIDFNGDGDWADAGEQIAADTVLVAGANEVAFTVPTVVLSDTLNGRFRYSTQTGLTPTGLASDGEIEDHQFGLTLLDLGDLPDVPYPTLLSSDGARHVILEAGNPTLGSIVDAELDGQPNVTATGDDVSGVPDDEDGVTFSGPLVPGEVVTITVSATADATGLLNAWIDFDGNGSLTDSGEQIALNVTINAGGSVQLLVSVPVTATQGITTYARFRFSTQSGLTPTGLAPDGEVEDYAVRILRLDYGDAPEPTYPTYHASDGPRHIILDADNPTLGTTVDAEEDGQPNGTATGDDVVFMPDDEDGVRLDSPLIAGEVATLTITGTNVTGARLNAWIDFNGDGDWADAGEQIAADTVLVAGANEVVFTVPTVVLSDTLNGRFRYSTQTGLTPTGLASDGEIEDHQFGLTLLDLGDLPDVPYPTLLSSDGARHVILEAGNPTLGVTVDAELDGQPNVTADGDDNNGVPDDEDGVTFSGPLVPGEVVTITVSATADATGLLNAWLDFDGNGSLTDSGEQIALNVTINAGGSVQLLVPVPVTATQGITTYSRFRFSTQSGLAPTGRASDGEIEDYALLVQEMEYGDLPDGPYPTLFASDGARHILDGVTHLGSIIDADDDGQPSTNADGDDGDGSDDEDGVTFITPLMQDRPAQIRVQAGSAGYLNGWIDFDGDGLLDTVNVTAIDGVPVVSTMNDVPLATGVHTFTIGVPDVAIGSSVYSRFRFTSYDTNGNLSYTGLAADGEVEDYVLMSLGNLVWMDNGAGGGTRNDGALNGSESGIPSVELELYRYDDLATPIATTTTDAGGYYRFTGLIPYTYVVHIPASEFGSGEPLDGLTSSTGWGIPDDDDDQDVDENGVDNPTPAIGGISSLPVTLSLGDEPTAEDGDGNSNLTVDFGFYGGRIGDYVWLELVRDGEQGTLFENPIPGVVVDLYDSATGAHLASDTTDSSGLYLFDDLGLNVTYTVQLSQINFAPGGALYPYTPTIFMAGSATPATDSDGSPDALFGGFGYAVTTTLTSVISEDLTLDFGFHAEPDLELVKTVAPGVAARNMPFTYSIRIQNTGQVTFTAMRLTDTLPSADFHYIGSSGDPADPNTISEPLLVWDDLVPMVGQLPPGDSVTVTFAVTATPGITGTYWNTATVRVETVPGDVLTDTDNAPVDIRDPAVLINKEILGIDRDGVAPDYVTFTIAITNVGPSVIDQLPMVDQYDPYYLSFEDATPDPDSVDDSAGRLVWNDLTVSLGNLSPGDSFHVTTVFNIAHEINVTTTNVVTVSDVVDLYENPANDDDDEKEIGGEEDDDGVPTAIEIVYFRAVGEEASVRLEWATAAELNLEGFHVYRAQNSSFDDALLIGYVPATGPGSTYSYVDRDVTPGQPYWYWLVEEVSSGEPDTYGPAQGGAGIDSLPNHLYLPLVLSNAEGLIQRGQEEQSAVPAPRWADWLSRRWLSLWVELLPESRRM